MTDNEKAQVEKLAVQMADEVGSAMERVMAVTLPDTYEGMIANVAVMRYLGQVGYDMLDPQSKTMVNKLVAVQGAVLGPKLAKLMDEAS